MCILELGQTFSLRDKEREKEKDESERMREREREREREMIGLPLCFFHVGNYAVCDDKEDEIVGWVCLVRACKPSHQINMMKLE